MAKLRDKYLDRIDSKKILGFFDPRYYDQGGNRIYPDDPYVDGDEEDNVGNGPGNPGNRIPTPPDNSDNDGPSRDPGPTPPINPDDPRYGADDESDDNDHREDVYQGDEDGDGIINGLDDDFQNDRGGIFGGLFNGLGGLGIGNLIQSIIAKYTDSTVTGGEQIRNQWDIDKMNMSNEFSAQQAEIARDWQEQMYQQYNSLSGRIQQAEEAGVNPMFAVNNGASVSPSSPSPSGAVASGSGRGAGGSGDLVSMIATFAKLKADVDKTKSETQKNESESKAIETQTEINLKKLPNELANMDSSTKVNLQKVVESATSVEKMKADIGLTTEQAEVAVQQVQYLIAQANYINAIQEPEIRLKRAQAEITEWQNKNKKFFKGLEIGSEAIGSIVDLGVSIFNAKTGRIFANK